MNQRCLVPILRALTQIVRTQDLHRRYIYTFKALPRQVFNQGTAARRCFTTDTESLKEIYYEEVKKLMMNKNVVIIDVREPDELVTYGTIPGSINIPLDQIKEALGKMSDDIFFRKYDHKKPDVNQTIIFSCRTGRRSKEAQILASQLGYKNALNYLGGWIDWAEKSKR